METGNHLDVNQLDSIRAGEATSKELVHVENCQNCQSELHKLVNLQKKLQEINSANLSIPKVIDEIILISAEKELRKISKRPILIRRITMGSVAAAMFIISTLAYLSYNSNLAHKSNSVGQDRILSNNTQGDLNKDDKVDIVDAYILAVYLQSNSAFREEYDINRDKLLNNRDVDEIAFQIVDVSFKPSIRKPIQRSKFRFLDILIDSSDKPLTSYQFELKCDPDKCKIVGISNGDDKLFNKAPYYDSDAMNAGRIIIASLITDNNPPKGIINIARIHIQEEADEKFEYLVDLIAASTVKGKKITAKIFIGGEK